MWPMEWIMHLQLLNLGKMQLQNRAKQPAVLTGFIPTGAYPSAVSILNPGYLYVCNLEAAGARVSLNIIEDTSNPDLQFS